MFVDEVVIHVESGKGGDGCESYIKRSDKKYVPTGGDGGAGGDVLVRADRNIADLEGYKLHQRFRAESGHLGSSNQKKGRKGEDLILRVPCGTTLFNVKEHLLVRDLQRDTDEVILLKGGRGGLGNSHGRGATKGQVSGEIDLILTLKILADVFLVGWPNSGKSLLLQRLTGAKTRSESYPFSTKEPRLGCLETKNYERMTLCELPSLTLGSSQGRGLGNRFLKHLERAKLLLLMLDPLQETFDLESSYNILRREISAYNDSFSQISHLVVMSKGDDPLAQEKLSKERPSFLKKIIVVSGVTGAGTERLTEEAEKVLFHEKAV